MHPAAGDAPLLEVGHGGGRGLLRAERVHFVQFHHADRGRANVLATRLTALVAISRGERHYIGVGDIRPEAVDVGQQPWSSARGQGEVHVGHLTGGALLGLVEVDVSIEE